MSAKQGRQWRVVNGLTEQWLKDMLFEPQEGLRLTVGVVECKPGAKVFGVTIKVTSIYAGTSVIEDDKTERWSGDFFVEGLAMNYPEITGGSDHGVQLQIKISGKIGNLDEARFEVIGVN